MAVSLAIYEILDYMRLCRDMTQGRGFAATSCATLSRAHTRVRTYHD